MAAPKHDAAPQVDGPELLQSQLAIKAFCDDILGLSPSAGLIQHEVLTYARVSRVQTALRRTALGGLILDNAEALSQEDPSGEIAKLTVGKARQLGVSVRGFVKTVPALVAETATEASEDAEPQPVWSAQMGISLVYADPNDKSNLAVQVLAASTDSYTAGMPFMRRYVSSRAPGTEDKYSLHKDQDQPFPSEVAALTFVALSRQLLKARVRRGVAATPQLSAANAASR